MSRIDSPTEPYAFKGFTLEQILAAEQLARETIDSYVDDDIVDIIRHALTLGKTGRAAR